MTDFFDTGRGGIGGRGLSHRGICRIFRIDGNGTRTDPRADGVKYNMGRCRETETGSADCETMPFSASSKDNGRDISKETME